jgi:hypothetical protein
VGLTLRGSIWIIAGRSLDGALHGGSFGVFSSARYRKRSRVPARSATFPNRTSDGDGSCRGNGRYGRIFPTTATRLFSRSIRRGLARICVVVGSRVPPMVDERASIPASRIDSSRKTSRRAGAERRQNTSGGMYHARQTDHIDLRQRGNV